MKVYGFSFVRNALILDYPVEQSIRSLLPLVDKMIIAVGKSEDDTAEFIREIAPEKIEIIHTVWDENLRHAGKVLAAETNKALRAIPAGVDWAFYLQADEVIHEDDYDTIRKNMYDLRNCQKIDGLLFDYIHFYGSYDWIGGSYSWYRHEVRIIRPSKNIYSYRDAQGFRKTGDKKLNVLPSGGRIFHYGWVRNPAAMERKQKIFTDFWREKGSISPDLNSSEQFDYEGEIRYLIPFKGRHPAVMKERIKNKNWSFTPPQGYQKPKLKDKLKGAVEKLTGYYIGFKNYRPVKPSQCK